MELLAARNSPVVAEQWSSQRALPSAANSILRADKLGIGIMDIGIMDIGEFARKLGVVFCLAPLGDFPQGR